MVAKYLVHCTTSLVPSLLEISRELHTKALSTLFPWPESLLPLLPRAATRGTLQGKSQPQFCLREASRERGTLGQMVLNNLLNQTR